MGPAGPVKWTPHLKRSGFLAQLNAQRGHSPDSSSALLIANYNFFRQDRVGVAPIQTSPLLCPSSWVVTDQKPIHAPRSCSDLCWVKRTHLSRNLEIRTDPWWGSRKQSPNSLKTINQAVSLLSLCTDIMQDKGNSSSPVLVGCVSGRDVYVSVTQ